MEELYKLKKMLCEELENYGKKGDMSAGSLDIVDKLAHAVKNIDKIIENYDDEGGSNYYPMYRSYARDGRSYAQRRDARGRYSRNYSMEGYSRYGDTVEQLRDLMDEMPNEQTRNELQRLVNKMENM